MNPIQHNVRAVSDALFAPTTSPAASLPFTRAAKMIATIPIGRQQQRVTRTAGVR